jgi:hypothetical protein
LKLLRQYLQGSKLHKAENVDATHDCQVRDSGT